MKQPSSKPAPRRPSAAQQEAAAMPPPDLPSGGKFLGADVPAEPEAAETMAGGFTIDRGSPRRDRAEKLELLRAVYQVADVLGRARGKSGVLVELERAAAKALPELRSASGAL